MKHYSPAGTETELKKQKTLISILLILTVFPSQLSIDLYLPSLPYIQKALHTSSTNAQATLSVYLIGVSIGILFYGTLSDRFGRKIIMLLGLGIYNLVTLVCLFTNDIQLFLVARLIQGLSIASIFVNRAVLRDVFDGKQLVKSVTYLSLAWVMIPILAPFFGGIIQRFLGWRANFVVLFLFSSSLFVILLKFLPETNVNRLTSLNLKSIIQSHLDVIRNPIFSTNLLACALSYAAMIAFSTAGPYLIQTAFHLQPSTYGFIALIMAIAYLLGNLISIAILKYYSEKTLIFLGILLFFISSLVLLILALLSFHSLSSMLVPIFMAIFSTGFIYPACSANSIMPFKTKSGVASALFTNGNMLLCFAMSYITAILPEHNQLAFSFIFIVTSLILILLFFSSIRSQKLTV
ncbi:MAG: multidrug effflux MFS transporter [Pseudomonadota bacterium]